MWIKKVEIEGFEFEIEFRKTPISVIISIQIQNRGYNFFKSLSIQKEVTPELLGDVVSEHMDEARKFVEQVKVSKELSFALRELGFKFV